MRAAQRSLARLEALRSAHDAGDGIGVTFMLVAIGVERGLGCHTQALGDDRDGDAAVSAADLSDAEAWLMLARAFKACSRDADAVDGLARGLAWVASVAVEQVPAEFLDSFLHRNAAHRELLTAAAREPTLAGSLAALRSLALSR